MVCFSVSFREISFFLSCALLGFTFKIIQRSGFGKKNKIFLIICLGKLIRYLIGSTSISCAYLSKIINFFDLFKLKKKIFYI